MEALVLVTPGYLFKPITMQKRLDHPFKMKLFGGMKAQRNLQCFTLKVKLKLLAKLGVKLFKCNDEWERYVLTAFRVSHSALQ